MNVNTVSLKIGRMVAASLETEAVNALEMGDGRGSWKLEVK